VNTIERILWPVFCLNLLVLFIHLFIIKEPIGIDFDLTSPITLLVLVLPVAILFLHSTLTLGKVRGLFFVFLASIIGLIFEFWGLKTGTVFGGEYIYQSVGPSVLGVPLSVICFWSVFIYLGYSISNSFLYWLNKSKPSLKNKNLLTLLGLILLDGFLVVAIDLFMDPLQVQMGSWVWPAGGAYFGVPIGNFLGWFEVTILVTGIYRVLEYLYPNDNPKLNKRIFLISVLSYLATWLAFAVKAIEIDLGLLLLTGSALMLPPVGINLYLYSRWIKS
jgi:uncharacterized membrane protein